jgi:hypothetical protein
MKTIIITVFAVLSMILLASCDTAVDYDPNETALEAWTIMNQNLMDAGSFEFSIDELKVLFADEFENPLEIENTGTSRKVVHADGSVNMGVSLALTMAGRTNEVDVYFHDEFLYFVFENQRHKRAADLEIATKILYANMPDLSTIPIIADGIGVGSQARYREMNFLLDSSSEAFEFVKDSILDSFRLRSDAPLIMCCEDCEPLDAGLVRPETTIHIYGPVMLVMEIDRNHNLMSYTLAFTADINFFGIHGDEELRAYYEITKTVRSIGGVTIDLPPNLNEFINVS